jgi:biotin-dependent carboxylase-like uncharacterized protein
VTRPGLVIIDPGWLSTLQDLGRSGVEHLGIPAGGAADQYSASVGNVLVGNPRQATCLELTAPTLSARATRDLLISVTGATARVRVNGHVVPMWTPLCVTAGSLIAISEVRDGIRVYVCINGEIESDRFLGSAAPDARMGFPQRLIPGQVVGVDTDFRDFTHPFSGIPLFRPPVDIPDRRGSTWTITVTDGPETEAVTGIRDLLESATYLVDARSDHVGIRLEGAVAHPDSADEIVSHGVPIGAVEIPHSDELIVLGRARSLTAGYPIVAIATSASLATLGQAGPGRRLAIRWTSIEEAVAAYRAQQIAIDAAEAATTRLFDAVALPRRRHRVNAEE